MTEIIDELIKKYICTHIDQISNWFEETNIETVWMGRIIMKRVTASLQYY